MKKNRPVYSYSWMRVKTRESLSLNNEFIIEYFLFYLKIYIYIMKIAYLSLKKLKHWYTFENNKKYRQHKEKTEYVILEVIGDIFGNFISFFMKYEWPTPKKIKIFQQC